MLTQQSCSWCHELNPVTDRACAGCGHRPDLPRLACDCRQCRPPAGLPLPLGGNVIHKRFDPAARKTISDILTASIRYSLDHRAEAVEHALAGVKRTRHSPGKV